MIKTYTLTGFIDTMEHIIDCARRGKLVAASINLEISGLGRYSYQLLDGAVEAGLSELEGEDDETPSTAPGKGQRR